MSSEYDGMSMRQKGVVDAIALNRLDDKDLSNEEVVELAHELTGEKKYHPTIVSGYRNDREDAIEYRMQVIANERDSEEGNVETIGDPMRQYTGSATGLDYSWQDIQDRPAKYSCDVCQQSFETPQEKAGHMNGHTEDEMESDDVELEASTEPDTTEVDLRPEELFDVFRNASEHVARSVFERVTDTELPDRKGGGQ